MKFFSPFKKKDLKNFFKKRKFLANPKFPLKNQKNL